MNIYKIEFNKRDPQVITAQSRKEATSMFGVCEVSSVRDCGPYLSEGSYKTIRNELL